MISQFTLAFVDLLAATEAKGGILDMFGIAWPKFIAQVIIIFIVYKVLEKKAFGPIVKILDERRNRIAETEKDREAIKSQLSQAETRAKDILTQANRDAERLIAEANSSASTLSDKKRQEAIEEAGRILAKAREAAELEREKTMDQLKTEFGRLVADTTSRVTGKVLDKKDHDRINQETVSQLRP